MNFDKFKKINDSKLNYREMMFPSVMSLYRNAGCGDGYRIYIKVEDDSKENNAVITDCTYTTTGCGFGVTALEMATEWVKGKTLGQAVNITSADIESLFQFPPMRKTYPETASEAMQKAVLDHINDTGIRQEEQIMLSDVTEQLKQQGHLREANLRYTLLENQNFHGVDFSGADLSNSSLQNTSLEGANLCGVRLRGSFLNNANLANTNLQKADLRWCKLSGANLDNANVDEALYDIGTKFDTKYLQLFKRMKKTGKDIYIKK